MPRRSWEARRQGDGLTGRWIVGRRRRRSCSRGVAIGGRRRCRGIDGEIVEQEPAAVARRPADTGVAAAADAVIGHRDGRGRVALPVAVLIQVLSRVGSRDLHLQQIALHDQLHVRPDAAVPTVGLQIAEHGRLAVNDTCQLNVHATNDTDGVISGRRRIEVLAAHHELGRHQRIEIDIGPDLRVGFLRLTEPGARFSVAATQAHQALRSGEGGLIGYLIGLCLVVAVLVPAVGQRAHGRRVEVPGPIRGGSC